MSILDQRFADARFAVIDLETTGLRPGFDEVVELSVVWVDPGVLPAVALDTLVAPLGHLQGTQVHGVTLDDLSGAPRLVEIAGDLAAALADRIVVGHQAVFHLRFLADALRPWLTLEPPAVDTSALGAMLGDPRGTLTEMCSAVGIARSTSHLAAVDAIDTARLLAAQLARANVLGLRTFRELARRGSSACVETWTRPALALSERASLPRSPKRKSRLGAARHSPLRAYADALVQVLADGHVDDGEIHRLREVRDQLALGDAEVRAMHAQVFAAALLTGMADSQVQDHERTFLANLATCLRALGWCPGD